MERAAGILLALGNGQGEASLTELARHLGIHKSTTHNILETLGRHGFVSRDNATRRYRLGPTLAALGHAAAGGPDLAALARPHLIRLQRLSGETVTLHARDGAGSVILASEESSHELKVSAPPGHRLPPTAGAVAKILLAFGSSMPPGLPEPLPAFTPRTMVSPTRYLDELCRVRQAGVAYDEMEYLPGVRAVSVPVFSSRALARSPQWLAKRGAQTRGDRQGGDESSEAIAALSIVGVAARVSPADLRRLAVPLRRASDALATAMNPQTELKAVTPARTTASGGRRRRSP